MTSDNMRYTPAWACPARHMSCRRGLSLYPGAFVTSIISRVKPPYITLGIASQRIPASMRDSRVMSSSVKAVNDAYGRMARHKRYTAWSAFLRLHWRRQRDGCFRREHQEGKCLLQVEAD